MADEKDHWIDTLVAGNSFMDVGGLWGTVNEKVTRALKAGARKATMADITPPGHQLWRDFDAHCRQLQASGYDCLQLDIVEPPKDHVALIHDVVHCSGIVYHVPDPYRMLANLRKLTAQHLIITSMVVPEHIANSVGRLDFPADRAAFVPSLLEPTRAIVAAHFDALGLSVAAINTPLGEAWRWPDDTPNYGPWWWLMSPAYLRGLLEVSGFTVEDECWSWEGRSYSFLPSAPADARATRALPWRCRLVKRELASR